MQSSQSRHQPSQHTLEDECSDEGGDQHRCSKVLTFWSLVETMELEVSDDDAYDDSNEAMKHFLD